MQHLNITPTSKMIMEEEIIIQRENVMMTTIKIATKVEDAVEAVAIIPTITDAEEDKIP